MKTYTKDEVLELVKKEWLESFGQMATELQFVDCYTITGIIECALDRKPALSRQEFIDKHYEGE